MNNTTTKYVILFDYNLKKGKLVTVGKSWYTHTVENEDDNRCGVEKF